MSSAFEIEFFGPPAVGKTTLSMHVAQRLSSQGYSIHQPTRSISAQSTPKRITLKTAYAFSSIVQAPSLRLDNAYKMLETKQETPYDAVRILFNWLYITGLSSRSDADITIYDQGIFQAMWSIGFRSNLCWEDSIRSISVDECSLPDLIVIVRADKQTIQTRLGNSHRSKTRVMKTHDDDIQRAINGVNQLSDLIKERSESLPKLNYIDIENSPDEGIHRTANDITARIEQLLNNRTDS